MTDKRRAIVLLSGGMNAATLLYDLVTFKKDEIVDCMIFNHTTDLDVECARETCEKVNLEYSLWSFDPGAVIDPCGFEESEALTARVELMHMLFQAAQRAIHLDAEWIFAGFQRQHLPCPDASFWSFAHAAAFLAAGIEQPHEDPMLMWKFPFLNRTKGEVFKHAMELSRLPDIGQGTTSCHIADTSIQHPWGYGCGSCAGCVRRWNGWDEYLQIIGQGPKA